MYLIVYLDGYSYVTNELTDDDRTECCLKQHTNIYRYDIPTQQFIQLNGLGDWNIVQKGSVDDETIK